MSDDPPILDYPHSPSSPPRRNWRRIILWAGGTSAISAVFLLIVGHCALNYLFFGKLTQPTMADFTAIAIKNQYIVKAIYDFKADHGMLPQGLPDLVPTYLLSLPPGWLEFDSGALIIPAGAPHTYVSYSFQPGSEGWTVGGDFANGTLPAPKPATTHPSISGDALIAARIAEYDRRIAADPKSKTHYTEKIAYLLSVNRKSDALAVCKPASQTFPTWWRPQMALAALADSDKREQAESQFRKWVEANPAFIHWWYLSRLDRDHGRDAEAIGDLQNAVHYPVQNVDDDESWVPYAFAFDAASYAYQQKRFGLVLDIARVWSSPKGDYTYFDGDIYAFRAAAELALGQFPAARSDADNAVQFASKQAIWAQHLPELQHGADIQDQNFIYDPGTTGADWTLFPPP